MIPISLDDPEQGFLPYLFTRDDLKINVLPDRVEIDPNYVEDIRRQFARASQNYNLGYRNLGSDKSVESYNVPIIQTAAPLKHDKKILMIWDGRVPGQANYFGDPGDYMCWRALQESFVRSGAEVAAHYVGDAYPPMYNPRTCGATWARDLCLIIDDTAYFPDADAYPNHNAVSAHHDAQRRLQIGKDIVEKCGLSVITLPGIYFDGGNFIEDVTGQQLFWGKIGAEVSHDDRKTLARAIYRYQGKRYEIVPVVTSKEIFHIDLVLSDEFPGSKFLLNPHWMGAERVRASLPAERLIMPDGEEITDGVFNLIPSGGALFMTSCHEGLREKLERCNHVINAPVYEKSRPSPRKIGAELGGGTHCLTQKYLAH